MRSVIIAATLFAILAGGGCAASRGITDSSRHPLAGKWLLEINSNDIGYALVPVTIEVTGRSFEGHSSEGVAGRMFGWWDYFLAKLFTDYFERGALLHLKNGTIDSSGAGMELTANLVSAIGPMRFTGKIVGGKLTGTLSQRGHTVGVISGSRNVPPTPLRDYVRLAHQAIDSAEGHLYSPGFLTTEAWGDYRKALLEAASSSGDDLEMLFAGYRLRDMLPFSHFALYAPAREKFQDSSAARIESEPDMSLEELPGNLARLRIASFAGGTDQIDSLFSIILRKNYPGLIIDLRGNPGGNISAMRVAAYLIDSARFGGEFVTRRWFEHHDMPPSPQQSGSFPVLDKANYELLTDGLHHQEGIAVKLLPAERRYRGRVAVLTDGNTASSCEPLVYGIKEYRLGMIIGEPTAGAMLSSEEFPLSDGWAIVIPTAEYYAADGYRIDRVGVQPDIRVASAKALERARAELSGK
jgi:hypothetical protein